MMISAFAALAFSGAALAKYSSDGGVFGAGPSVAGQPVDGWYAALNARSEALNRHYGLAKSVSTQGTSSPNDHGGMIGIGAAATSAQAPDAFERAAIRATNQAPDAFERAAIRAAADTAVRPDDRAGVRGPGLVATADTLVRPDDRVGIRGPGSVPTGPELVAGSTDNGFEWGDASIGAGLVLGLLLVAGLIGLTIRHRGGPVSA